jgi:hypothetical protein
MMLLTTKMVLLYFKSPTYEVLSCHGYLSGFVQLVQKQIQAKKGAIQSSV